jgi:two-component system, NarL family, invasion response regulator UvrY
MPADAPATRRQPGDQASAGGTIRVLVADDSPAFRRVAGQVIELSPGFELAATAATSEEAVELTTKLQPDLVLMDVRMPAMGGIDAARTLAADSGARVVLISSGRREDTPGISATDLPYMAKTTFGPAALRALWDALTTA